MMMMMMMMMMMIWDLAPCRLVGRWAEVSPEDGDNIFLRNVGIYRRVYAAPKPRRTSSSSPP
jgi:hypothetical protein